MSRVTSIYQHKNILYFATNIGVITFDLDEQIWDMLISAFPNAKLSIEHISFTDEKDQPKKAAIRWALVGSHSGKGNFGDPSHAQVYIMGISHAEFGSRGIKNEWVLFDETMIWKQILMKTG